MSQNTGFWDKRGAVTPKGQAFCRERLNAIRKEFHQLDKADFATSYLEDVIKEIYADYLSVSKKYTPTFLRKL